MKYIMKKNNVEREADTEHARENLERLGYKVVRKEQEPENKSDNDKGKAEGKEKRKSSAVKQNPEKDDAAPKTEE